MSQSRVILALLALLMPVLFAALGNEALAQPARISGRVVAADSDRPIAEALVNAPAEPNALARSDESGRFAIVATLPARLVIARLGFAPETVDVTDAKPALRIGMRPAALVLTPTFIRADQATSATASRTIRDIDIAMRPRASSQELLRLAPGLVIAQHAGGGKAEQIFLRGFDADHGTDVAVSVDGVPVNMVSHGHGQGYADLHFVLPEVVNRVDVRKGPYDTQDGDLAVAGAINLVTRDRIDERSVAVRGGSFNARNLTTLLPFGGDASRAGGYVAGALATADGPFTAPQGFRRWNAYGKYTAPVRSARVGLTLSSFGARWNASGQIPDRAVRSGLISRFGAIDSTEGGETSRSDAIATFSGKGWGARVFATRYDFRLFSNFTFFLNDSIDGDGIEQLDDRRVAGGSIWAERLTPLLGSAGVWRATVGTRWDDATVGLFAARNRQRLDTKNDDRVRIHNVHAALNRSLLLGSHLRATVGIRADGFRFDVTDRTGRDTFEPVWHRRVSPKGSLAFEIDPTMTLFANLGAAFHSNDARAVVRANSTDESLPKALGYEVGARRSWNGGTAAVSAWGLDLTSELVWSGDGGTTEPSGRSRRIGIDLEGRVRLLPWLWADADVNVSRGRLLDEPQGANRIPLAPGITTAGGLTTTEVRASSAGLRWRHVGTRPANEDNSVGARGYALVESFSTIRIGGNTIRFAVDNVFNVRWNEAQFATTSRLRGEAAPVTELHYTPGAPRTITLGLERRF